MIGGESFARLGIWLGNFGKVIGKKLTLGKWQETVGSYANFSKLGEEEHARRDPQGNPWRGLPSPHGGDWPPIDPNGGSWNPHARPPPPSTAHNES